MLFADFVNAHTLHSTNDEHSSFPQTLLAIWVLTCTFKNNLPTVSAPAKLPGWAGGDRRPEAFDFYGHPAQSDQK